MDFNNFNTPATRLIILHTLPGALPLAILISPLFDAQINILGRYLKYQKTCASVLIAGPNGAGKTTFAKAFLPEEASCLNYVNADLIAEGLSPFKPESVAIESGKLLLKKIDHLVEKKESFAFETTLSGLNYIRRIKILKNQGYEIVLFFLTLPNEEMAVRRVKLRVAEGGHNIPVMLLNAVTKRDGIIFKIIINIMLTHGLFLIILEKYQ